MRRLPKLAGLCVLAAAASACSDDKVIQTESIPTAGVRFINAVPDTSGAKGLDMRFVDIVESNAHFNIGFRNNVVVANTVPASTLIEYKNTRAGQRHFRIFLSDTLQSVASVAIKDTTVTIEAGKKYTVLLWGFARTGQTPAMRMSFIEDNPPDPGTQVAIRILNATTGAIEARPYVSTATVPATAAWPAVPAMSFSAYTNVAPATYRLNFQPAGGGTVFGQITTTGAIVGTVTNPLTDPIALPGAAAASDIEALPGTTVAGSAITAIVFPRSVSGAKTPQTAVFGVPYVSFIWDRRPTRTCSPLC